MVLRNKLFIIIFSVIVIIVAAATMYFYSAASPDIQRKPGLPPVTEQESEEPEKNQEPILFSFKGTNCEPWFICTRRMA